MVDPAWTCRRGESVLIPSGPDEKLHLFAIIIDPVRVDGYGSQPHVLLVSVCSVKPGLNYEDVCLLGPGDHPFIQHASFVDYRKTRLEPVPHVEGRVKEGVFLRREACSEDLIRKIVRGALNSRRIAREHKMLLEKVLLP